MKIAILPFMILILLSIICIYFFLRKVGLAFDEGIRNAKIG